MSSFRPSDYSCAAAFSLLVLLAAFASSPETRRPAPWVGLALLIGMAVPMAAARDFVASYRPHHLPNGCLPEAILFHDAYERQFPEEKVEVMLLELPDENGAFFGHAVALFTEKGRLFAWDFQMGRLRLDPAMPADRAAARAAVTRAYRQASKTFASRPATLSSGWRDASSRMSGPAACATVAQTLSAGRKPLRLAFSVDDRGRREAVAFVAFGLVWVYTPDTGTAFFPVTEPRPYDQLILAALNTRFTGAIRRLPVETAPVSAPRVF